MPVCIASKIDDADPWVWFSSDEEVVPSILMTVGMPGFIHSDSDAVLVAASAVPELEEELLTAPPCSCKVAIKGLMKAPVAVLRVSLGPLKSDVIASVVGFG